MKTTSPKFDDKSSSGGLALVCPCGSRYTHQGRVDVFDREKEDGESIHTTIEGGQVMFGRQGKKNPSRRRNGLTIFFSCENCSAKNQLAVFQHKGTTYLDWVTPEPTKLDKPWVPSPFDNEKAARVLEGLQREAEETPSFQDMVNVPCQKQTEWLLGTITLARERLEVATCYMRTFRKGEQLPARRDVVSMLEVLGVIISLGSAATNNVVDASNALLADAKARWPEAEDDV